MKLYGQAVSRLRMPMSFPVKSWNRWKAKDEQALAEETILHFRQRWAQAAATHDIELM